MLPAHLQKPPTQKSHSFNVCFQETQTRQETILKIAKCGNRKTSTMESIGTFRRFWCWFSFIIGFIHLTNIGYIAIPCKMLKLFPGIEIFWNQNFIIVILFSVDIGNLFSNSEQMLQDKKKKNLYIEFYWIFPSCAQFSPKMFCKLKFCWQKTLLHR